MGVAKKTRKFAAIKRVIGRKDDRLHQNKNKAVEQAKKAELIKEIPQAPSQMFFKHNTALTPPYNLLIDTNFFNHCIRGKLSLLEAAMDCVYAKCNIFVTSCVMGELEKLGPKYRLALRVARDERWQRVTCSHQGTYADDCIVDNCQKHRIYIVATNDRELKRRLRKIPGVPIMSVARGKFTIEGLPNPV
ncbi:FCF1 small subunit [Trichoderma ceciliae]